MGITNVSTYVHGVLFHFQQTSMITKSSVCVFVALAAVLVAKSSDAPHDPSDDTSGFLRMVRPPRQGEYSMRVSFLRVSSWKVRVSSQKVRVSSQKVRVSSWKLRVSS